MRGREVIRNAGGRGALNYGMSCEGVHDLDQSSKCT